MVKLPIALDVVKSLTGLLGVDDAGRPALTVVKLKRLECETTEDSTGADEAELYVYLDDILAGLDSAKVGAISQVMKVLPGVVGGLFEPESISAGSVEHKQSLNDGQSMTLGTLIPLLPGRSFAIKLMEEDSPDADDHIASVTVRQHAVPGFLQQKPHPMGFGPVPTKSILLAGDDAVYWLHCEVSTVALEAIPSGDGGGGGGVVPDLPIVGDPVGDLLKNLGLGGVATPRSDTAVGSFKLPTFRVPSQR